MKERAEEMEAVRTTIVGGRPPGCGRRDIRVPRGIEVLVKKAAVDEAFRQKLLAERGAAAGAIGLALDPAETAMLGAIAEEQLAGIIRQTVVPAEQRRVFLGPVAAAMLAVLVGITMTDEDVVAAGGGRAGLAAPRTQPATGTAPATAPGTQPVPVSSTVPFGGPARLSISAGAVILEFQPATAPSTAPGTGPASLPGAAVGNTNLDATSTYSGSTMIIAGAMIRIDPQPATSTAPATGPGTGPAAGK